MYLGIEIGGTKLQLAVGAGDGSPLVALEHAEIRPECGAEEIRQQVELLGHALVTRHKPQAAGIGFGGPVDAASGRTIVSHQVDGWKNYPLADWCRTALGLPAVIGNDSDAAGLAEARFGAGRGARIVFYSNVGSGIGGALVIDGRVYQGCGGIASELGHLRPGLQADWPDQTVESLASGWAMAETARSRLAEPVSHSLESIVGDDRPARPDEVRQRLIEHAESERRDAADLLGRCDGRAEGLTTAMLAEAARAGNHLAREVFDHASQVYGWALAQMITLLAPEMVVVGGGVAQAGEEVFFEPLRKHVRRYVFPPLADSYRVVPSLFGQEVVLQGAMALAADGA